MNRNSEQLTYNLSLIEAPDQPLRGDALFETVINNLGINNCEIITMYNQKVVKFHDVVLLIKAVTYLGNPHPIFKKRIQLPDCYQDYKQIA